MAEILTNNEHHIERSAISCRAPRDTVPKYSDARRGDPGAPAATWAGPSMASRALTRRVEKARQGERAESAREAFSARSCERPPDAPGRPAPVPRAKGPSIVRGAGHPCRVSETFRNLRPHKARFRTPLAGGATFASGAGWRCCHETISLRSVDRRGDRIGSRVWIEPPPRGQGSGSRARAMRLAGYDSRRRRDRPLDEGAPRRAALFASGELGQ